MGLLEDIVDVVIPEGSKLEKWIMEYDSPEEKEPGAWDILMGDVETEGKKWGYKKAARKYESAFSQIEKEYKQTKEIIKNKAELYDKKSDMLIQRLEYLENSRKQLEKERRQQEIQISEKYDISIEEIRNASATGGTSFIAGPIAIAVILGTVGIYGYKKKKFIEAEQQGYEEARKLYEKKIGRLQRRLAILKDNGDTKINEMINMIERIMNEIADEQMRIADLRILLENKE